MEDILNNASKSKEKEVQSGGSYPHYQYFPTTWTKTFKAKAISKTEEETMLRKLKELQLKSDVDSLTKMQKFCIGDDPDVFLDEIFMSLDSTHPTQPNEKEMYDQIIRKLSVFALL